MLTGSVIISDLFAVLTASLVSAHGAQHADTLSCSCWEFSFQFYAQFLTPRNVKPVKHQFFQILLLSSLFLSESVFL